MQKLRDLWRGNHRLRWLAALTAVVLLAELGFRWLDWFESLAQTKTALGIKVSQLQAQSGSATELKARLQAALAAEQHAKARLLTTRSEAAAQAQLQDWLLGLAAKHRLVFQSVSVGAGRPISLGKLDRPDERTSASSGGLIELPVNLSLFMAPESVVSALPAIEAGPWLLRVQSLSVRAADRRIEIGLLVPARVGMDTAK